MADRSDSNDKMEWSSGRFQRIFSWTRGWTGFRTIRNHSTPIQQRPLPTASPNLSRIFPPNYVPFCFSLHFSNISVSDGTISQLSERFAKIKLE